ncbi:hypothetical protein Lalb_Chr01g0016041 [Lupinus albus]|uniref:Uncharacterized protein n=1 Tax=Lupinus albus TaxID=3870 RepID=A0A6A4R8X9_LUPAL|nr:hypothetical protein Lalb_Chr01g0016041 [Lupinus albus]
MKVLFLCALLLSMAMLNQGVMGDIKSELCKLTGNRMSGCQEIQKPHFKKPIYKNGRSSRKKW